MEAIIARFLSPVPSPPFWWAPFVAAVEAIWCALTNLNNNYGRTTINTRPDHPISRDDIDDDVLRVLYRLKHNNFEAFIVGGVRDMLHGKHPNLTLLLMPRQ